MKPLVQLDADDYLCLNRGSFHVFQFFTKPKPPKGYYIYGDVGKNITKILFQSIIYIYFFIYFFF